MTRGFFMHCSILSIAEIIPETDKLRDHAPPYNNSGWLPQQNCTFHKAISQCRLTESNVVTLVKPDDSSHNPLV